MLELTRQNRFERLNRQVKTPEAFALLTFFIHHNRTSVQGSFNERFQPSTKYDCTQPMLTVAFANSLKATAITEGPIR